MLQPPRLLLKLLKARSRGLLFFFLLMLQPYPLRAPTGYDSNFLSSNRVDSFE
jgi:hypothetical protein